MRHCSAVTVLLAIAVGQAVAGPFRHAPHLHQRKNAEPIVVDGVVDKRAPVDWNAIVYTYSSGQTWGTPTSAAAPPPSSPSTTSTTSSTTISSSAAASSPSATGTSGGTSTSTQLTSADANKLKDLGFQAAGTNAQDSSGGVWIGDGGAYTSEFTNNYSADLILVVWGPWASWVNVNTPLITVSLPAQASTTISFADQQVGAWSAIYPDTPMAMGQIANTWVEYTFNSTGVVDVTRLVNGTGYSVEVVGPQCTTNMDTCVFKCVTGNTCTTGYVLDNCAQGSQPGAQDGTYQGADSGGCGWNLATSASFKTSFGDIASS